MKNQTLKSFFKSSTSTVKGAIVMTVIGIAAFWIKSEIRSRHHQKDKDYENKAERIMTLFKNEQELELFRAKMKMREEFSDKRTDNTNEVEYNVYSPSDYLKDEYDVHPMIGNLLPENFDALLYGMKNTMKSYFAVGTMIQVALGQKPAILSPAEIDSYTAPPNVYCIYVDGENGGTVFKDRYASLGNSMDGLLEIVATNSFGGNISGFFNCLRERCERQPSDTSILLCVDNIKSLLNDLSQSEGRRYLNEIKQLRSELKARNISLTTITICHTEKTGEKIFGSYNLPCLTPFVIRLDECADYDHIAMTMEYSRTYPKGEKRTLVVRNDGYKYLAYEEPEVKVKRSKADKDLEMARKIAAFIEDGHTKTEAGEKFGLSRPTINERLKLLGK